MRPLAIALLSIAVASPLAGRRPPDATLPPVRPLRAITASSSDNAFVAITAVRALSDGRVLVNDLQRRTLYLLDSTLRQTSAVVGGAVGQQVAPYPPPPGGDMIPYRGDSTVLVDGLGEQLVVISPAGTPVRAITIPPPAPLHIPTRGVLIDRQGRLVFAVHPTAPPSNMTPGDSDHIVRLDLDTRKLDTLAAVRIIPPEVVITVRATPRGGTPPTARPPVNQARRHRSVLAFEAADDWVMTSDGWIAIVRSIDYHVDWIDPSGARQRTLPTQGPIIPLSPAGKQHLVDSIQVVIDSVDAARNRPGARATLPPATSPLNDSLTISPLLPDSLPPFAAGGARADADGRVWVREGFWTRAGFSGGAPIYDVIDHTGQIVDRVQLPAGRTLAGFGPRGVVFLAMTTTVGMRLERALP